MASLTTPASLLALLPPGGGAVLHFSASWCAPCRSMQALLDSLLPTGGEGGGGGAWCVFKVEAEGLGSPLAEALSVEVVPTVVAVVKRGEEYEEVGRVEGASPLEVGEMVKRVTATSSGEEEDAKAALNARLGALVRQSKAMLFMKGTRDEPRCGFSRRVADALTSTGCAYETFDILEDQEVRQGLKEYSDWPTYPQLYVNGELVGGCDIIMEMHEADELKQCLEEEG